MSYITQTVDDFFVKLDKMQGDLAKFSQSLDDRSEKIPTLLKSFEQTVFASGNKKNSGGNAVERAAQKSLDNLRVVVDEWSKKIEADRKGKQFIKKNEKYLVVMIFGSVSVGKSTLGNFFAGQKFFNAPFDNYYKKIAKPVFMIEERGSDTGDLETDSYGDTWFQVGALHTTTAILYFTLSGLRWIDSPGTGALSRESDIKDMNEFVEEYLGYADMCIFLMNSAQPGLQDDMRYMQKLSREGQDALIVITRSDKTKAKVIKDEFGNKKMGVTRIPKDDETRKLQEDDICARVKENYPEIDANKFRAISISTALANEAVEEQDDEKFRASNLDKLMKILGDKVSDNAIARKQENPRRLLNTFVDSVVDDLKNFSADLNEMTAAVEKYKADMAQMTALIVTNVSREVRSEVSARANEWNRQVKRGSKIDNEAISAEVSEILQDALNTEINLQMRRVIEDFQSTEFKTVKANISAAALEKKTVQIAHTYTTTHTRRRDPRGIIEHITEFLGKEHYETYDRTHTEYQIVDLGTNLDEFLDRLMPQVEEDAKRQTTKALVKLRDGYFAKHENFARNMRGEIDKLRGELLALKF